MTVRPNIAAMSGYVPGEQPQGGKLIKLNTNENPYVASAAVATAIQRVVGEGLRRYPDPTATAFRLRAGEILGVEPDWIMCGNGSDDILTIVTRTFVGEGQQIRSPYPSYVLYKTLANIQGADCERIRFNADWTLPENFAEVGDETRLVFLANPNSPSGTLVRPEEVLQIAERLPCPILVDEAYGDFAEANCISLVKENPRIMVSRSMSKSYALAGLRFGFIVAQPNVIVELNKVKDSYNCDALSIAAATAAIDDQAWLSNTRAQIIASRGRFEIKLAQLGLTVQPSQANFVWATYPGMPLQNVYEQLKASGVLVRYMDYDGWDEGLRCTVGTDDQIDACLELLKQILHSN